MLQAFSQSFPCYNWSNNVLTLLNECNISAFRRLIEFNRLCRIITKGVKRADLSRSTSINITSPHSPWEYSTVMAASRNSILRLINASQHSSCPCHNTSSAVPFSGHAVTKLRNFATPVNTIEKEYAFEVLIVLPLKFVQIKRSDIGSR
jgi:hypothetical protein